MQETHSSDRRSASALPVLHEATVDLSHGDTVDITTTAAEVTLLLNSGSEYLGPVITRGTEDGIDHLIGALIIGRDAMRSAKAARRSSEAF